MELITERLRLRDIYAYDWESLYRNEQDERYNAFNDQPPMSADEVRDLAAWLEEANRQQPRRAYYLALTTHDSDWMIGSIKLVCDRSADWQAEIGYWIESRWWGQGYTTEAARAVLDFGFGELKLHRIYAVDVITENIGSARVLEKIGMRREAHLREARYFHGRFWDVYSYGILAREWAVLNRQHTP